MRMTFAGLVVRKNAIDRDHEAILQDVAHPSASGLRNGHVQEASATHPRCATSHARHAEAARRCSFLQDFCLRRGANRSTLAGTARTSTMSCATSNDTLRWFEISPSIRVGQLNLGRLDRGGQPPDTFMFVSP
ncbi:hypothetical protein ACQR16_34090 [Bradyrhizobium oligotrophicum]|uniref:hypothetical protein n=1 Tax=Bradyrhizobium oligotrophicum TaxID=44255 RepID=UPI003EB9C2D2